MTVALTTKGKAKTATPKPQAAKSKPAKNQTFGDLWSGAASFDHHTFTAQPIIQPKLKIGDPNDKYEQEADRVADEVMRMPDSEVIGATGAQPPMGNGTPAIQRMCSDCAQEEETLQRKPNQATFEPPKISSLSNVYSPQSLGSNSETRLQRQEMEEEEEPLQMKQESSTTPTVTPGIEAGIQSLEGGGQPLSQSEQAFFEPRFGHDFSQVRVHTGPQANVAAKTLQAKAFATGNHIVLGAGQYSPATTQGRKLLAHELTHTIQQSTESTLLMRQTDEFNSGEMHEEDDDFESDFDDAEDGLDPDIDIDEQKPLYTGRKVGEWGHAWKNDLIAKKQIKKPRVDSTEALAIAIEAGPAVVLKEHGGYSVYSLEVGTSIWGFTNANTQFPGQDQAGFVQANVKEGLAGVVAFTTEDKGWMTPWKPLGAQELDHSLWYRHYGLPEDGLTAAGQNMVAFLTGFANGWSMDYEEFLERLGDAALLNTVFPPIFTAGALHGLLNEAMDLLQLLNPKFWEMAIESAKTVLWSLRDPEGEELAYQIGQGVAMSMSNSIDKKVKEGVVAFTYEFGKIVGPILVEIVLALMGVNIGLLTILQKSGAILSAAGDFTGLTTKLRKISGVTKSSPDLLSGKGKITDKDTPGNESINIPDAGHAGHAAPLTQEEWRFLRSTQGDPPISADDAARELGIVLRSQKGPNTDTLNFPDYKYEVNLGNGHSWRQKQRNGEWIWCRFSVTARHCTPEGKSPKAVDPKIDVSDVVNELFEDVKLKLDEKGYTIIERAGATPIISRLKKKIKGAPRLYLEKDANGKMRVRDGVKKVDLRTEYLGGTMKRDTKEYGEFLDNWRSKGRIRIVDDEVVFIDTITQKDGSLRSRLVGQDVWFSEVDMDLGHIMDAVEWWNKFGKYLGKRSEQAREFMKDPNNYQPELFSINREMGSRKIDAPEMGASSVGGYDRPQQDILPEPSHLKELIQKYGYPRSEKKPLGEIDETPLTSIDNQNLLRRSEMQNV